MRLGLGGKFAETCGSHEVDYCSARLVLSKTARKEDEPLGRFAVGQGNEKERRNQPD